MTPIPLASDLPRHRICQSFMAPRAGQPEALLQRHRPVSKTSLVGAGTKDNKWDVRRRISSASQRGEKKQGLAA